MTSPLKPFSRAASSRSRANARSFSTIRSSGSPGWIVSRSSPTSLTSRGVSIVGTAVAAGVGCGGAGIAVAWRTADRGRPRPGRPSGPLRPPRHLLGHVGLGQVERERAPLAGRADQADLAAQQPGDLAADRQAQAGPPYLRLVLPSACWNASKMICCLSGGMPMPVSETEMASTVEARFRSSFSVFQPPCTGSIDQSRPAPAA